MSAQWAYRPHGTTAPPPTLKIQLALILCIVHMIPQTRIAMLRRELLTPGQPQKRPALLVISKHRFRQLLLRKGCSASVLGVGLVKKAFDLAWTSHGIQENGEV